MKKVFTALAVTFALAIMLTAVNSFALAPHANPALTTTNVSAIPAPTLDAGTMVLTTLAPNANMGTAAVSLSALCADIGDIVAMNYFADQLAARAAGNDLKTAVTDTGPALNVEGAVSHARLPIGKVGRADEIVANPVLIAG